MRKQPAYDQRIQVRQYVARVQGPFCRFTVLKGGLDGWYVFMPHDFDTDEMGTLLIPVRAKDLRDDIRRALAHGWGNVDERLTFREQRARANPEVLRLPRIPE